MRTRYVLLNVMVCSVFATTLLPLSPAGQLVPLPPFLEWYESRVKVEETGSIPIPEPWNAREYAHVDGLLRELVRGSLILTGPHRRVYGVAGDPTMALDYADDSASDIHALARDFSHRSRVWDLGVCPKPLGLSAPAPIGLDEYLNHSRTASRDRSVRFMVTERYVKSIGDWVNEKSIYKKPVPVGQVIQFLEAALDGLREIHDRGIVHGKIAPHSVVRMLGDRSRTIAIGFTDFSRSFDVQEATRLPDSKYTNATALRCFQSHWNHAGFRDAFRDDVFKLLMVGGYYQVQVHE